MVKVSVKNGNGSRASNTTKYDAHHKALSQTYGALADLRRELSDSKAAVSEREEILRNFSTCPDSQRAWLLLEDYFERLSLSRKDFPAADWWPRVLAARGKSRLEELRFSFCAPSAPRRRNCSLTPAWIALPGSRRPSRSRNSCRLGNTGCSRRCHRISTRRAPRCGWFARRNRTRTRLRASASPCNFICSVRAPAKKSARCAS